MSFGNAAIFPFPAVQYIPLSITDIGGGNLNKSDAPILPTQILAGTELVTWSNILKHKYGLKLPEIFPEGALPIMVINLKVNAVYYRGYFVTMTGSKNNGRYQLFSLPRHYFYKSKLLFELFDENTGKRLARYSLFMP